MAAYVVKLVPFSIPVLVWQEMPPRPRQEGLRESPKFSLGELDDTTLGVLCEEFRVGVFARAAEQRKQAEIPEINSGGAGGTRSR